MKQSDDFEIKMKSRYGWLGLSAYLNITQYEGIPNARIFQNLL